MNKKMQNETSERNGAKAGQPAPPVEGFGFEETVEEIPGTLPTLLGGDENSANLDLDEMHHLLITGRPGSGKTATVDRIISNLLEFTHEPLQLLLFSPRTEETQKYSSLPQLVGPVIQSPCKLVIALQWAVQERNRRAQLLNEAGEISIRNYNNRIASSPRDDIMHWEDCLTQLVIVLDGLESCERLPPVGQEAIAYALRELALSNGLDLGIHLVITGQSCDTPIMKAISPLIPGRIYCRYGEKSRLQKALALPEEDTSFFNEDFMDANLLGRFRKSYFAMPGTPLPPEHLKEVIEMQGERSPFDDDPVLLAALGAQAWTIGLLGNKSCSGGREVQIEISDLSPANDHRIILGDATIENACELARKNSSKGWFSTIELSDRLRIPYDKAAALMEELARRGLVASEQWPFGLRRIVIK